MISRMGLALLLVALSACSGPVDLHNPDEEPDVVARTSWALSHRVVESGDIRIIGGSIGHYDESTHLSMGTDAEGLDMTCYVSLSAPGQGGPEMMVGEKVPTTVRGRPGVRNGAGAEAPYLMWQHDGQVWTEVSCRQERFLGTVADAVVFGPSSITLPFGLAPLPGAFGFSHVSSDLSQGSHQVYLGKVVADFGHADPDVVVSYETGDFRMSQPGGRAIAVNGRPAFLDEDREAPGICVAEQQRFVCVRAYVSDTGPYPDRTDEIPTLLGIADGLRFAADLDDRSTWLDSNDALPQ